jgi:hypothetical protein
MNLKGDTEIKSYYGATVSLLSIVTLIIYATIRVNVLESMRDTVRSSILVQDWIDETTHFSFRESKF